LQLELNPEQAVKLEASQLQAKRQFKRRNPELDSELRNNKLKIERNSSRLEPLELVVNKPHSNLNPIKFKSNRYQTKSSSLILMGRSLK
jgi:hypothetical protein